MAKPGSAEARKIAGGVDLSSARLTDDQVAEAQELVELSNGYRCGGCGRRITIGYTFMSIAPRDSQRPVLRLSACSREDCDHAEVAHDGATVMEMVEYAWLDELGPDAPPARAVVKARAMADAGELDGVPAEE